MQNIKLDIYTASYFMYEKKYYDIRSILKEIIKNLAMLHLRKIHLIYIFFFKESKIYSMLLINRKTYDTIFFLGKE